jgi:hypothetical protein
VIDLEDTSEGKMREKSVNENVNKYVVLKIVQ